MGDSKYTWVTALPETRDTARARYTENEERMTYRMTDIAQIYINDDSGNDSVNDAMINKININWAMTK